MPIGRSRRRGKKNAMQVRACQIGADAGGRTARLAAIRWLIADAAMDGADVVVFPELAVTGYGAGEAIRDKAETIDGPVACELRRLADEHGIAVIAGLAVREGGDVFNAALVARPRSAPIVYAKRHLYGDYEKALFSPGTAPSPIFEIGGMKAGVLVCFDVEFPERVWELAMAGAEVVFVPTALPSSDAGRFIAASVVPVRAFENQIFIVYVDHCGNDERFSYRGLSVIAAPDGSRLTAAAEDRVAMLSATIEPEDFEASRARNPYLEEWKGFLQRQAAGPLKAP